MARQASMVERGVEAEGMLFLRAVPLYASFAATGAGCALMGVLLPTLLVEWRLTDHAAGLIFFLVWIGSSLGALMVLSALRWSIATGCASVAAAAIALAFVGAALSSPMMLLFGIGLGLAMTSISLLRQQVMRHARSVELVRLNLMWALGACACPLLMTYALRSGSSRIALLSVAVVFAVLAPVALAVTPPGERLVKTAGILPLRTIFRDVPLALIVMTMLSTGIEASGGSWLATYAHRTQPGLLFTIAAPTCLWAGLLGSRFLGSFSRIEREMRRALPVLLTLVAVCTLTLVAAVRGSGLLWASLLLGFGLGPLYPIFLARVMLFQQGGAIFFLAGVASAAMPWMTGVLSSHFNSLNMGLLVPAAGALLLLLLGTLPGLAPATPAVRAN